MLSVGEQEVVAVSIKAHITARSGPMTTQIELARKGLITPQMGAVAAAEDVTRDYVRTMVAEGKIVIPWNTIRKPKAVGIGKGLRTKINASIGTSSDIIDYAAGDQKGENRRGGRRGHAHGAFRGRRPGPGAARGDRGRGTSVGNVPLYQAFVRPVGSTVTRTSSMKKCFRPDRTAVRRRNRLHGNSLRHQPLYH